MRSLAPLTLVLVLLSPCAHSDEPTLLICDGESIYFFKSQQTHDWEHQITLRVGEDYIQSSNGGTQKIAQRGDMVIVWTAHIDDIYTVYNLNVISGKLTKMASDKPIADGGKILHKATYLCRKVQTTLLD